MSVHVCVRMIKPRYIGIAKATIFGLCMFLYNILLPHTL